MNQNARAWIDALRSGEYSQTRYQLKDYHGFCCLGVACDLYAEQVGGEWNRNHEFVIDSWPLEHALPVKVMDWLGLRTTTGHFECGQDSLSQLNDRGASFIEIADRIEREAECLFKDESKPEPQPELAIR